MKIHGLTFFTFCFAICLLIAGYSSDVFGKRKVRMLKCPSQGSDKVVICHIPPGKPENQKILVIHKDSVENHLGHGDRLGICPDTKYQEMKDECGICDVDVDPGC